MGVPLVGVAIVLALTTAAIAGGGALFLGRRFAIVDRPDGSLKPHQAAAVPLGGLALMIALHLGLAVAGLFDLRLFLATALVWAVGLVDDLSTLTPWVRLLAALVAGAILVSGLGLGWVGSIAAVALIVVLVNAVNMLDGVDAVAAGVSAVAILALGSYAILLSVGLAADVAFIAAAATLGFLVWNLPPARLFLGDNGAYSIAVVLGWLVIRLGEDWPAALVAAAIVGVPLLELAGTVLRRLRARGGLFEGDRDHSYDRLRRLGLGVGSVAIAMASFQFAWATFVLVLAYLAGDVVAVIGSLLAGGTLVAVVGFSRRGSQTGMGG